MFRTFLILCLLVAMAGAYAAYAIFISGNVNGKHVGVKIPTGSNYEDVVRILEEDKVLNNEWTFNLVSQMKHYPEHVKPGYYVFTHGMDNRQMVNMLRLGLQTPVTLVIYNVRTKEEFAGLTGRTLEIDSTTVLNKLNDPQFYRHYGLDSSNILTHFITDNYEFYWNIPLNRFFERMDSTYNHFWDDDRRAKAKSKELTPSKATILASIVEKEVLHDKELPTVAGVYLNRLKLGMPLQADPTLVFALHDFEAHRVNSTHKEFDSPYNTYLHAGLPPGPICMPRKKSIDAVLNADECDYLYFCANPDMSGYSLFSKTYTDQMKTAHLYRKKLDEMNVH